MHAFCVPTASPKQQDAQDRCVSATRKNERTGYTAFSDFCNYPLWSFYSRLVLVAPGLLNLGNMDAIFLDIETTGLDAQVHRPIDIAFKILDVNTHELKSSFQSVVKWPQDVWAARDPTSTEINGFTWEDVCTGLDPEEVSRLIKEEFLRVSIVRGRAVFICQNPSFDRAFFSQLVPVYTQEKLNWPYHWLDFASMYWAKQIQKSIERKQPFPEKISLSKNSIAQVSGLSTEITPHRAINGVNHLIQCYLTVLYNLHEDHFFLSQIHK